MSVRLSKTQLANIKNYRYNTNPWTWLDNKVNPWWEFAVNSLPMWLSPNLITFMGCLMPILSFIHLISIDTSMTKPLPVEQLVFAAFSAFWFQTCDCVDGKQARRTGNCSALGQILDHTMDQLSGVFFHIQVCSVYRSGSSILPILMASPGYMLPHYTIEYRKHFTQFHSTVVETAGGISIGQTEAFFLYILFHLTFASMTDTTTFMAQEIDLNKQFGIPFPFQFSVGSAFGFFTSFYLGAQYCIGNIYVGIEGAKDKIHAISCVIPFIQVIVMLVAASQYSNFWSEFVVLFNFGIGIFLTCATAHLNLSSCAGYNYSPYYLDPIVFGIILYVDTNQLAPDRYVMAAYVYLMVQRCVLYLIFIRSMAYQICDHLEIPFLYVKQGYDGYERMYGKKKE